MEINDVLKEFGLGQYEKMAYLALLSIGRAKSAQIAKASNVSYGRIYEILQKLEEKGLIMIIPTEPKTFEAIEPKQAFNMIIRKKEESLNSLKREIETIKIPEKKEKVIEQDKIIVLQGKQKQISMISEMHERAKKDILMIPGVYEPIVSRKVGTLRALNNGVKIKRIIRKITPKNREILKQSVNLGEELRRNLIPGLRLIVIDEKEAMISIVNEDSKERDRMSIYTTNKNFAKSMATFFDSIWENSEKVKAVK